MNEITVSYNEKIDLALPLASVAAQMRLLEQHKLSFVPWKQFPYKPDVAFSVSYGTDCFALQFYVHENHLRAENGAINEPVYEDSCVEFFLSLDNGATYYNFEFNCIGTVLCGFGSGRADRRRLDASVLSSVHIRTQIERKGDAAQWELTALIPFHVLAEYTIISMRGFSARANFYKCGDKLPQPHYVAWSNIQSEQPDFHLPQFFGRVNFE